MKLIAQAKSNPITVASVLVVLLCLVVLGWLYMQGSALEADMAKRVDVRNELQGYVRKSVRIPPEKPTGQPRQFYITINKPAIESLKAAFEGMGGEFATINEELLAFNQRGHELMDANILPRPRTEGLRYEIKSQYRQSLKALLDAPKGRPFRGLDAGMPPNEEMIERVLNNVAREYRQTQVFGANMSANDHRKVRDLQRTKLMDLLMERAQQVHVYAQTELGPDFPLDTSAIPAASAQVAASDAQIWEGQVSMWIQQDIIEAIGMSNNVNQPNFSVIHAPVKRLLGVMVVPGSVGINSRGGLGLPAPIAGGPRAAEATTGATGGGFIPAPTETYGTPTGMGTTGPGGVAVAPPAATLDPREKLPVDFAVSPSGRITNPLFDVRHTWVSMVVNDRDIPLILDNLSKINFNTVLISKVTDVDEYEALRQGFVYGTGDAVRLDVLVESIWFRQWTATLMPPMVRQTLGIPNPETGPGMTPGTTPGLSPGMAPSMPQ